MSFYYQEFGIRIVNFISISEVLVSILDDVIAISTIIAVLPQVLMMSNSLVDIPIFKNFNKVIDTEMFSGRISLMFRKFSFLFILMGLNLLGTILIRHFSDQLGLNKDVISCYSYICFSILLSFVFFIEATALNKHNKGSLKQLMFNLGLSMFMGISFIMSVTMLELIEVQHKQRYNGVVIEFKDEVITSNSQKYYIGKTEDYIFIYDDIADATNIRNTNDLISIKFPKNRNIKK